MVLTILATILFWLKARRIFIRKDSLFVISMIIANKWLINWRLTTHNLQITTIILNFLIFMNSRAEILFLYFYINASPIFSKFSLILLHFITLVIVLLVMGVVVVWLLIVTIAGPISHHPWLFFLLIYFLIHIINLRLVWKVSYSLLVRHLNCNGSFESSINCWTC